MRILIGIDDTDNKDSRGTGFLSRQLAKQIEVKNLGKVSGITRHQLFIHPDIAYTSQNSSACLDISADKEEELRIYCENYIKKKSAIGSDAGLCIAGWDHISDTIIEWGFQAKQKVLKLDRAIELAKNEKIFLKGYTGILIGQIGALAAVGLRKCGNDGRFIWLDGPTELRELKPGIFNLEELKLNSGIENFITLNGLPLEKNCRVLCHDWIRPILKDSKPTLILEKNKNDKFEWKAATKEYIRTIS